MGRDDGRGRGRRQRVDLAAIRRVEREQMTGTPSDKRKPVIRSG